MAVVCCASKLIAWPQPRYLCYPPSFSDEHIQAPHDRVTIGIIVDCLSPLCLSHRSLYGLETRKNAIKDSLAGCSNSSQTCPAITSQTDINKCSYCPCLLPAASLQGALHQNLFWATTSTSDKTRFSDTHYFLDMIRLHTDDRVAMGGGGGVKFVRKHPSGNKKETLLKLLFYEFTLSASYVLKTSENSKLNEFFKSPLIKRVDISSVILKLELSICLHSIAEGFILNCGNQKISQYINILQLILLLVMRAWQIFHHIFKIIIQQETFVR